LRARGERELRVFNLPNAPATWADGTRTILDIAGAMAAEYAPISAEALEAYFRAFEKAGAMKVIEKQIPAYRHLRRGLLAHQHDPACHAGSPGQLTVAGD